MADTKIKDLAEKATGAATDEFAINDVAGGNTDKKMGMDGVRITESQITDLQSYALATNKLDFFAATTSAELITVISDETGTGDLVFATSPTLITPALGTPASGVATNLTGTSGITGLGTQSQDLNMNSNDIINIDTLGLGSRVELTISTGAVVRNQSYHSIDTEADASTDDLDRMTGQRIGDMIIMTSANSARDPTIVDVAASGSSRFDLAGNFTLDAGNDTITIIPFNTEVGGVPWTELSRSNNA